MKYDVVVAEDEVLLLNHLIQKVENSGTGFKVAGSAQTGVQALELIDRLLPCLLITDIRMPAMDGLALIARARETHPDMDFIITSGFSDFEYAQTAIRYQVSEYLLKPVDAEELNAALLRLKEKYLVGQNRLEAIFNKELSSQSPAQTAQVLKDYINGHYQEEINLNLIAGSLNYSPSYLTKIFCQQFDTTPSRYLITLRIQKARQLLSGNPELTIRQIGEAVGYPEQGYFSRIFKKQTGVSPLEFREMQTGVPSPGITEIQP